MAACLARLAEHGLAVLGTDFLYWDRSVMTDWYVNDPSDPSAPPIAVIPGYESTRMVVLSVEPLGRQSRRVRVSLGSIPPVSVPPDGPKVIYVDGLRLVADEGGRYIPSSSALLNSGMVT